MMKQTSFVKDDATFPALDQPLTLSEMSKTYKAIGNDFLSNGYFIEGIAILCSHLCDLFISILDYVYFPDQWYERISVPVKTTMCPMLYIA